MGRPPTGKDDHDNDLSGGLFDDIGYKTLALKVVRERDVLSEA